MEIREMIDKRKYIAFFDRCLRIQETWVAIQNELGPLMELNSTVVDFVIKRDDERRQSAQFL